MHLKGDARDDNTASFLTSKTVLMQNSFIAYVILIVIWFMLSRIKAKKGKDSVPELFD